MKVKVYQLIKSDTLRHRDTAKIIIDYVNQYPESTNIILDFENIHFASRSFCHELRRNLDNRQVSFINMDLEIKLMMDLALNKPRITLSDPENEKIKVLALS